MIEPFQSCPLRIIFERTRHKKQTADVLHVVLNEFKYQVTQEC